MIVPKYFSRMRCAYAHITGFLGNDWKTNYFLIIPHARMNMIRRFQEAGGLRQRRVFYVLLHIFHWLFLELASSCPLS